MMTLVKLLKIIPSVLVLLALSIFITNTRAETEDENTVYLPLIISNGNGTPPSSDLSITQITDNSNNYAGQQIPKFEKYEITFQIENSVAQNLQFPYDASPLPASIWTIQIIRELR